MRRIGERLVDRQVRVNQGLVERADGTSRLAVAELGGITVISGFAIANGLLTPAVGLTVLGGVFLAIAGTYTSMRAGVGNWTWRVLRLGPDLSGLRRAIVQEVESETETHLITLVTCEEVFEENQEMIDVRARLLVVTSHLLAASAIIFLIGLFYMIGGLIHG